jgi:hypothetical protein
VIPKLSCCLCCALSRSRACFSAGCPRARFPCFGQKDGRCDTYPPTLHLPCLGWGSALLELGVSPYRAGGRNLPLLHKHGHLRGILLVFQIDRGSFCLIRTDHHAGPTTGRAGARGGPCPVSKRRKPARVDISAICAQGISAGEMQQGGFVGCV